MALFSKKKEEEQKKAEAADAEKTVAKSPNKDTMKDLYAGDKKAGSKAVAKKDAATSKKTEDKKSNNAYRILVKPLVTEKAANLNVEGKYVFEVFPSANKIEVAKAINEIYGVNPVSVNIIKMKGKKVRHGRITFIKPKRGAHHRDSGRVDVSFGHPVTFEAPAGKFRRLDYVEFEMRKGKAWLLRKAKKP